MEWCRRNCANSVPERSWITGSGQKTAWSELFWTNIKLAKKCRYSEIQPAVNDSGNNDRVVVLPGHYTEPTSRAQPLNDPRCADMKQKDSGGAETPSYQYQVTCPNDQNLIHIAGREVGSV